MKMSMKVYKQKNPEINMKKKNKKLFNNKNKWKEDF